MVVLVRHTKKRFDLIGGSSRNLQSDKSCPCFAFPIPRINGDVKVALAVSMKRIKVGNEQSEVHSKSTGRMIIGC